MTNLYCKVLGIDAPALEEVKDHDEASSYSMLLVALLERGAAMTLDEVAGRFAEAGIASADAALRSLRRCRPARVPVYRDGDLYALDPHDDELDLWAFRLGLRPARRPRFSVVRPEPEPLGGPTESLTIGELDEAWSEAMSSPWSAQRIALAVLDAHGRPMTPVEVVGFVDARCKWHGLSENSAKYWRRGAPVRVRTDGRWDLDPDHGALLSARQAVRERIAMVRRYSADRPDPVVMEAQLQTEERRRAAKAEQLARLRRVIVHAYPSNDPRAVVLLDVGKRELRTFLESEVERVRRELTGFDVIGALDVRTLLRRLDFEAEERWLAELGPPQKTIKLNKSGRTLAITTPMLIRSSCDISRPLGDAKKLGEYIRRGEETRLRRRLESDAKSLYALYQYGRLHGSVRLRWGFLDETLPVRWSRWEEDGLYQLKRRAHEQQQALEVVVGTAPGWVDPWARAKKCRAEADARGFWLHLVGEDGDLFDERAVQCARLVAGQ